AAVSLVITPILVGGLGRTLYGIWEMLNRIVGYMAATDGRPTEALRLVISQQQAEDHTIKRRSVGAALVVWLLMIPLVGLVGGILAWLSPTITHAPLVPTSKPCSAWAFGCRSASSCPSCCWRAMS